MDRKKGIYEKFFKRCFDIVLSGIGLIVLSPIFIIVAVLVRTRLGNPIIFKQERPGKDGKVFMLMKFRSMSDKRDENGQLLPDAQRLTKFGRILRSTSMDELPELINIIKGDMSIVGPRPLLVKYMEHFNDIDRHRHDVRPGLTGLAQVSGRNAITWKERFEKDIEYVNSVSFLGDIKIMFLTVKKIFVREGIEFKNTESIFDYFEKAKNIKGE